MKTKLSMAIIVFFMMVAPMWGWAQESKQPCRKPQMIQMLDNMPGITADQKTKIEALRVPHLKEMQELENKMRELKAHDRTLSTTDKTDLKAVYANIDEITKLQNQMMKKQAEHRSQVRSLLNDEQKLWFDNHPSKDHNKEGKPGKEPGRHREHEAMPQTKE